MINRANQTWPPDTTHELPVFTGETLSELAALVTSAMDADEAEDEIEYERRMR